MAYETLEGQGVINGLALCAGYGGLELGCSLAGLPLRVVCHVEREAYAVANAVGAMAVGMASGGMDPAPIWDDLETFSGFRWRGRVDLITAGIPCQPWSQAGKRLGEADERWIWGDVDRIISEVVPSIVFLENVPGLKRGGLGDILGTFQRLGLSTEWGMVRASDAGAPHRRARIFILAADADRGRSILRQYLADAGCGREGGDERREVGRREPPQGEAGGGDCGAPDSGGSRGVLADADGDRREGVSRGGTEAGDAVRGGRAEVADAERSGLESVGATLDDNGGDEPWDVNDGRHAYPPGPGDRRGWEQWTRAGRPQPSVRGANAGTRGRVDRLRLLGNGVVPQQAALAIRILGRRLIG